MPALTGLRGRALPPRHGSPIPSPLRSRIWLLLAAGLVFLPRAGLAKPLHEPRATVSARPLAWRAPGLGTGSICGSSEERAFERLAAHAAWQAVAPATLPTTESYDHGDIAVIEDDGTLLVPVGSHLEADEAAVARAFYRTHGDDYDYLCLYVASSVPSLVLNGRAFAFEMNIHQDVQGIGLSVYDLSLDMGSAGRLRSFLEMNNLAAYPADPFQDFLVSLSSMDVLAHEAAHRCCAFVKLDSAGTIGYTLLGAGRAHWNFYFDNGACMVGGNDWQDNGDGTWTTAGATLRYGPIERYLLGYAPASEVDSFIVLEGNAPTGCQPPANYTREHHPLAGVTCPATPQRFSIQDVISANGPRLPDAATSPKHHRYGFILLIANGTLPTQADLDKLNAIRSLWPSYLSQITEGEGTADVTLSHQAGSVALDADPVPDSENPAATHPVTARASIVPGSLPLTLDASSVALSYGVNGGPLQILPMSEGPAGTFTAAIPPEPTGSVVRYAVHAASDSSGIEGWWPPGAPAVLDTFRVGPDAEPPKVSFLSPPAEILYGLTPYRFRALASDNLGLARVFATLSWNDGARDTLDMTREGDSDTFHVDVVPLALAGDRVAIDAHAVDASAAAHTAVSAQCPIPGCGFEWGYDWIEPLDLSNGGLTSSAISLGNSDAWHWTSQSDATGRASWKCGDPGVLHYLPNLDAGLVTPPFLLTGDAELRLRHRYDLEAAGPGLAYDGARVEISVGGGAWNPLTPTGGYPSVLSPFADLFLPAGTPVYSGTSAGWDAASFQEAVFPVAATDTESVRLRFRMLADDSVGGGGWFIDDLRLIMKSAPVAAGRRSASALRFASPTPNPSHDAVRFEAELATPSHLALEIFDARGRRVDVPFQGDAVAGPWSLTWGARHKPGAPSVSAGLYFARLTATPVGGRAASLSRRFVILD